MKSRAEIIGLSAFVLSEFVMLFSLTVLLLAAAAAHIHTHKAKEFSISPPLPRDRGRGILGCFLEDERHCNSISAAEPLPLPKALVRPAYRRLPIGTVSPTGWLARQLVLQADGMSGWYQALFYPPVNQSQWVGGSLKYDLHYMVTYWLNGNVALAALLHNGGLAAQHNLSTITDAYLDYILHAQASTTTGRLGPIACGNQFSKMNAVRSLLFAAEKTDVDQIARAKIGASILAGLREQYVCTLAGNTSGGIRWPSYVEAIIDYIDAFGASPSDMAWMMNVSLSWRASGANWERYYADPSFPGCPFPHSAVPHPTHSGCEGCFYHGVNTEEALKLGPVQWRLWGRPDDAGMLLTHLGMLEHSHGRPDGTFGMDEFLAGRDPHRGTELCDVVEGLYSLEWAFQQVGGDELLHTLDRAERLAFNALPGTTTPDMWQHQYDHQINAIDAGPGVYCGGSNGNDATTYGLQPHYPCCTVNLPQGWPKLAASAVLREGTQGLVIAHLLPLRVAWRGAQLSIDTEYPFGDVATITLAQSLKPGADGAHERSQSVPLAVRVPGWATKATIAINGAPAKPLANGTLHRLNASFSALAPFSAIINLDPVATVELGWGAHAVPAPSAVNYSSGGGGGGVAVPTTDADADWLLSGGSSFASTRDPTLGEYDVRSGSPGTSTFAVASHPINGDAHYLSSVSLSFQYVAGYTPGAGKHANASTLSLDLVDALNTSQTVAALFTSSPLGNYSFDRFSGYSPPVAATIDGLQIAWPRSLRLLLRFENRDRNVQIPIGSLRLKVGWGALQPGPFAPSDLSTAPTNAAAVVRGPLLFALGLEPTRTTLRMPAQGGECEHAAKGGHEPADARGCKSSDVSFTRGAHAAWNYALVLPPSEPSTALQVHRTASAAPHVPFDPAAPPLTVTVPARRVGTWRAMSGGKVTERPPPSPVSCQPDGVCSEDVTLRLVPFGSTQLRIALFPWIQHDGEAFER